MEDDLLAELPPEQARSYLVSLAQEQGAAALPVLRAAAERPALVEAALEALAEVPDQKAWDLLEHLAQKGSSRAVRKGARRAQHRLRSRGFTPAPTPPPPPVPVVEQAGASFLDFTGGQFLRVVRPAGLGMARCASFVVSPEGLKDCAYLSANRLDVQAHLHREDEQFDHDLVAMDLAYVARRVRQGVARSRERHQALPMEYVEASTLLEDAPEDIVPEELALLQGGPVSLSEVQKLTAHASMSQALLSPQELAPYVADWMHLLEYQPIRTEEGLPNLGAIRAQGQMVERIITDLIDADTVRRLGEHLAETARLLYALEEKDLAGVAIRCAAEMGKRPPTDDPFLRALVNWSMYGAIRLAAEEEKAARQGPWAPRESGGEMLWVPRPSGEDTEGEGDEEQRSPSGLWLPR